MHVASLFTKRAACQIFVKNRKQANCMRGVSFLATTWATTLFDARSKVSIWRYIGVNEASLFTKRAACKIFVKNRKQANGVHGMSFLATTPARRLLDPQSKIGVWRARGITFHKTSGVQDFRAKSKISKRRARDVIFSDDRLDARRRPRDRGRT